MAPMLAQAYRLESMSPEVDLMSEPLVLNMTLVAAPESAPQGEGGAAPAPRRHFESPAKTTSSGSPAKSTA